MGPQTMRREAMRRETLVVLAHASVLDRTGYARRAIDSALAWARVADRHDVLLASVESPKRLRDKAARKAVSAETKAGGVAFRVLHALPRRLGLARLSDRAAAVAVRRLLRREGATLVHAHGPRAAATALRAAEGVAVKVVVDVHGDRAAETRLERGIADDEATPPDPAEAAVASRADAVVHASEALARRFPPSAGRPSVVVPCLVAVSRVPREADAERLRMEARARWGFAEGDRVVAYAGSLAPWQEVPRLLALFARAAHDRPTLRLLLLTPNTRGIGALVAASGAPRARTAVVTPAAGAVIEALLAADAGVLLRRPALANRVAFPTKVAEYLAAGLSILASDAVEAVSGLLARSPSLGAVVPWSASDAEWASALLGAGSPSSAGERAARRAFALNRLSWSAGDESYQQLYRSVSRA